MAIPDLVNLVGLMDGAKCFAFICQRRWPEGILCPACDNDTVIRDGHDSESVVDHDADQRCNTLDVHISPGSAICAA
ncbi:MAG: transposase [Janthinobacterium lividum]